jgi:Ala-tRNA(Pro) deacylase
MSGIATRLRELLDANGASYEKIHHPRDFRALETAADTHTRPDEFAKTVFVCIDGRFAMAVLPANHSVALSRLASAIGGVDSRLATEDEVRELCPDCEIGAAPPFGNLYGLEVYVSPRLAEDELITFNAGSHEEALRLRYADFERLAKPRRVPVCKGD